MNLEKLSANKQNEVKKAIEMRKKILETGVFIYDADAKTAVQIWKVCPPPFF
jgi:hypothetical protein